MEPDPSYYDISKEEKESAIGFLLHSLLQTKVTHVSEADRRPQDEDVNIYLAHLLFAVATPRYQELAARYRCGNASDLMTLLQETRDPYVKYFIYKVNADHLLVDQGIFRTEDVHLSALIRRSETHHAKTAQSYYEQAREFNRRIYKRETAVGEVLRKLAKDFLFYRDILRHVRRDYFTFINHFEDTEFKRFVTDLTAYEKEERLRSAYDRLLDLYLEHQRTRDERVLRKLNELAREIQKLDPTFRLPTWRRGSRAA